MSKKFKLYRDGIWLMDGTELELWNYILGVHGFSVSHALNYEGYSITQPDGSRYRMA